MVIIDSRKLTDKESAHKYLKETLGLPDYYGNNLDALHDVLTEKQWKIAVSHTQDAGAYYASVRNVLLDAEEEGSLELKEYERAVRLARVRSRIKKVL